jgi:hypothetical protein
MGFGALYLLAFSGALVELYRLTSPAAPSPLTPSQSRFLNVYLAVMVVLAWAAVFTGAYVIYPWYRATPPPGTVDLSAFPQQLLMSNPATSGWHSLGMEWKEHVAWVAPMAATMVTFVLLKHRAAWNALREIRTTVLGFAAAFLAAAIAGGWGAMINKKAPVTGGQTFQLMGSAK